ncbi:beta-1,3-glucanosyltransferase [Halenospora varia]|nr:beta-1,3-glucanosyltransferase [Halenospora varia]
MGKSTPLMPLLATASLLLSGASATLDPIVIKGSKFFYKTNGTQFFIKGVAYQAGFGPNGGGNSSTSYVDPLADTTACARDIPLLQAAGANTIRTYAIDPTKNHDTCMNALDAAGIYVISDLGEPKTSIDRSSPQWTTTLLDRYTSVVDSLAKYPNVIGFFAGNEVPNNLSYTGSAAMVKAAVRDTKAYIKAKNYRTMGVGYAADDDQSVRAQVAAYFNCGDSGSQIDFWGYNIYEWCGDSSYTQSGYSQRVAEFQNYSVPSFFAEYGCNTQGGAAARKFTEIPVLYGSDMSPVFSGGIVYEYFQEENDYGLVSVSGGSASTLADYNAFSSQIKTVSPSATQMSAYSPTNTAGSTCPTVGTNWNAAANLPPTPDKGICSCMMSTLTCQAKSSIDPTAYGALFAQVCGYNNGAPCNGINRNTTTGKYGAYSMCNATEQLSYAFNAYYNSLSGSNKAQGCDFGQNATIVSANAASTCSSVLSSATAAASNGVLGGSGSGAASSTSKKSDGAPLVGATLGMGPYFVVGFTLIATISGAGMILL